MTDLLQKGWECPKCGAVMSPTTSVCVNCRGFTEVSISTNGITATDCKDYPPYLDRLKGYYPCDSRKEKNRTLTEEEIKSFANENGEKGGD